MEGKEPANVHMFLGEDTFTQPFTPYVCMCGGNKWAFNPVRRQTVDVGCTPSLCSHDTPHPRSLQLARHLQRTRREESSTERKQGEDGRRGGRRRGQPGPESHVKSERHSRGRGGMRERGESSEGQTDRDVLACFQGYH